MPSTVVIVIIVRLDLFSTAGDGGGAYQTPCRENGYGIFNVRGTKTATMVALTAREARHRFDMHNRVIHPSRKSVPRYIGNPPPPLKESYLSSSVAHGFPPWVRTQDLWLKMHSGQQPFARMEGQLAQLLGLYRSTSLEVVEGMIRHTQLQKIADAYASKKVRLFICV